MKTARSISLLLAACGTPAMAQLRVAAWNVSAYTGAGARDPSFRTALYGSYQGRSFAPDAIIIQELTSAGAAAAFLANLNAAAGSPGDWQAAPFVDGPDTDLALYYRAGKLVYQAQTLVLAGGNINGAPRDVWRFDLRLAGYTSAGAMLAIYGDHMKSGTTGTDQARRLVEAQAIRANANALPPGWQFVVGGDFNMQASTQAAFAELTGSQANNRGRFFDPISTPGTWNNTMSFRFVHTQAPGGDPANTGGMDDRLDFVLIGNGLNDGVGFDYIGNPALPYSTTTWNDPNHSFRCWGNDGSFYGGAMTVANNGMVGTALATAIRATVDTDQFGGHLPVFLDLRVPAAVSAPAAIDFGQVAQNSVAERVLTVANGGDVARWTAAGIAPLRYTLAASAGLGAPAGQFQAAPGGAGNPHTITMSTANPGPVNGMITIHSDAPDEPARVVLVTGLVVSGACYANCDQSTAQPVLTVADFACFLNAYASGDSYANCDGSTSVPVLNVADFACFLNAYAQGCP